MGSAYPIPKLNPCSFKSLVDPLSLHKHPLAWPEVSLCRKESEERCLLCLCLDGGVLQVVREGSGPRQSWRQSWEFSPLEAFLWSLLGCEHLPLCLPCERILHVHFRLRRFFFRKILLDLETKIKIVTVICCQWIFTLRFCWWEITPNRRSWWLYDVLTTRRWFALGSFWSSGKFYSLPKLLAIGSKIVTFIIKVEIICCDV